MHRLRDHGQGSAGAMQRRHTDPLHQQTPVGDAPGRPPLPKSLGPLAMAKQSAPCHLHGGCMRSSVFCLPGHVLQDISESRDFIPATWTCSWDTLRVGLQCNVSTVLVTALQVSLMQPQWKRELSMSSAKQEQFPSGTLEWAQAHPWILIKHETSPAEEFLKA